MDHPERVRQENALGGQAPDGVRSWDMSTFETETDSRGRVSLGRAGAGPGTRYRVDSLPDGEIRLLPVVSVPQREMPLLQDPALAQRVTTALDDAREGRTRDLGDFARYADE